MGTPVSSTCHTPRATIDPSGAVPEQVFLLEGKHSESCRFRRRQAAWNAIEQDLFRR